MIEFWNVYTRPTERNSLGCSVAETQAEVNRLKMFSPLLLWLKGQQDKYDFKHRVSEQCLIKNLRTYDIVTTVSWCMTPKALLLRT
ncbi:MAG: hypothetical protein V7K50_14955 [Nostoc sp.]